MTSIPASRNALAMILAPRSWPSRPGFAITTRIVPDTSAEYRGAPERHRLLSGLAEPRQRALGLHARGRRQPRLARLRPRSPGPPAGDVALARARRDRHHALPPRPLGRPRPVAILGAVWLLGVRDWRVL